jgi:hypothetical protein
MYFAAGAALLVQQTAFTANQGTGPVARGGGLCVELTANATLTASVFTGNGVSTAASASGSGSGLQVRPAECMGPRAGLRAKARAPLGPTAVARPNH